MGTTASPGDDRETPSLWHRVKESARAFYDDVLVPSVDYAYQDVLVPLGRHGEAGLRTLASWGRRGGQELCERSRSAGKTLADGGRQAAPTAVSVAIGALALMGAAVLLLTGLSRVRSSADTNALDTPAREPDGGRDEGDSADVATDDSDDQT